MIQLDWSPKNSVHNPDRPLSPVDITDCVCIHLKQLFVNHRESCFAWVQNRNVSWRRAHSRPLTRWVVIRRLCVLTLQPADCAENPSYDLTDVNWCKQFSSGYCVGSAEQWKNRFKLLKLHRKQCWRSDRERRKSWLRLMWLLEDFISRASLTLWIMTSLQAWSNTFTERAEQAAWHCKATASASSLAI